MKRTAELPVIGMDIAKNVFHIHLVDVENGEKRLKLKRSQLAPFFANHQPALVAMEACGGAHYWGRTLQARGYQPEPDLRSSETISRSAIEKSTLSSTRLT